MWAVLRGVKVPSGMLNVIRALYDMAEAVRFINGKQGPSMEHCFYFFSGILQGCPFSGSLFDLCLDPILRWLDEMCVADRECVRACADDLGGAFGCLKITKQLQNVFRNIEGATNLRLGTSKCVVVPLASPSPTLNMCGKLWMKYNNPEWQDFSFQSGGCYLGFGVGPRSKAISWNGVIRKFLDRSRAIAAISPPLSVAKDLFKQRCLTTISYVAQLSEAPNELTIADRRAWCSIFSFPYLAMTDSARANMVSWTGIDVTSAPILAFACRVRMAVKRREAWTPNFEMLRRTDSDMTLKELNAHEMCPSFWDTKAVACVLRDASMGLGCICRAGNLHDVVKEFECAIGRCAVSGKLVDARQGNLIIRIREKAYADDSSISLARRLPDYLSVPHQIIQSIDFARLASSFSVLPPSWSIALWRHLWGGWPTSCRYKEERTLLPFCGCKGGRDDLKHYISCGVLWRAVFAAAIQHVWFLRCLSHDLGQGKFSVCDDAVWRMRRLCVVDFCLSHGFLALAAQRLYCILKFANIEALHRLVENRAYAELDVFLMSKAVSATRHLLLAAPKLDNICMNHRELANVCIGPTCRFCDEESEGSSSSSSTSSCSDLQGSGSSSSSSSSSSLRRPRRRSASLAILSLAAGQVNGADGYCMCYEDTSGFRARHAGTCEVNYEHASWAKQTAAQSAGAAHTAWAQIPVALRLTQFSSLVHNVPYFSHSVHLYYNAQCFPALLEANLLPLLSHPLGDPLRRGRTPAVGHVTLRGVKRLVQGVRSNACGNHSGAQVTSTCLEHDARSICSYSSCCHSIIFGALPFSFRSGSLVGTSAGGLASCD